MWKQGIHIYPIPAWLANNAAILVRFYDCHFWSPDFRRWDLCFCYCSFVCLLVTLERVEMSNKMSNEREQSEEREYRLHRHVFSVPLVCSLVRWLVTHRPTKIPTKRDNYISKERGNRLQTKHFWKKYFIFFSFSFNFFFFQVCGRRERCGERGLADYRQNISVSVVCWLSLRFALSYLRCI